MRLLVWLMCAAFVRPAGSHAALVGPENQFDQALSDYRAGRNALALKGFLLVVSNDPHGQRSDQALQYVWEITQSIKKTRDFPLLPDARRQSAVDKAQAVLERRRQESENLLKQIETLARDLPSNKEPLKALRRTPLSTALQGRSAMDELTRLKAEQLLATIREALKALAGSPAPNPAELHEVKGYFWLYQGDLELVVQEWKQALRQRTLDIELADRLRQIESRLKEQRSRQEARHQLLLGANDLKIGQYKRALERIQKAAAIAPREPEVQRYLELAKKGLETASRQEKVNKLMNQGHYDYGAGRFLEAVQCWVDILVLDPSNEEARDGLKKARERLLAKPRIDAPKGPQSSSSDRGLSEKNAEEAYFLGVILYHERDLGKASAAFEEALRWQPGHIKAKKALEQVQAELRQEAKEVPTGDDKK